MYWNVTLCTLIAKKKWDERETNHLEVKSRKSTASNKGREKYLGILMSTTIIKNHQTITRNPIGRGRLLRKDSVTIVSKIQLKKVGGIKDVLQA